MRVNMSTDLLIEIIKTRIEVSENNPTSKSLLYELNDALQRLKEYEEKDSIV